MFVFKRKRFFLILCFLCISFGTYFASTNSHNVIDTQNRSYDITQVSAIPVTEKIIVIDAGHGRRRWRSCSVKAVLLNRVLT